MGFGGKNKVVWLILLGLACGLVIFKGQRVGQAAITAFCCADESSYIITAAGNGTSGYSGDGGPATAAQLGFPQSSLFVGGDIYIADSSNNAIRKVNANKIITTFAGNGTAGYSGDGGPASLATFSWPTDIKADAAGNFYIVDCNNEVLRKVNSQGIISTIAGNGSPGYSGDGGPATAAQLNAPLSVALDNYGNLYIADALNNVIRKVNTHGTISTIAGNGTPGFSGDNGPASLALINQPDYILNDNSNDLFFVDGPNNRTREINSAGIINTVAGNGIGGYSGDGGPATAAEMSSNVGNLGWGCQNALFIADFGNNVIRKIDAQGIIHTTVGTGVPGYSGDGGPASAARLRGPIDIKVDRFGNLYICDTYNFAVRVVLSGCEPQNLVSVFIYNSAGELVATLQTSVGLKSFPTGVTASAGSFVPDLGQVVTVNLLSTADTITWDGRNNQGQFVASGNYHFVADVTDAFGKHSSFETDLDVLRLADAGNLRIFNGSGELVRHWSLSAPQGGAKALVLSARSLLPVAQGGQPLQIHYGSGGPDWVAWDGSNDQGLAVSSGTYVIQYQQAELGGVSNVYNSTVTVLNPQDVDLGPLTLSPNPARGGMVSISWGVGLAGLQIEAQVYNLSGEMLASFNDQGHAGLLTWKLPTNLAPGIYMVVLQARVGGGPQQRRQVKLGVVR